MITLTDIAYVRSGVADLDAATRFATGIVGLELVTPTEVGVAHLRADGRHHCLALVEGPSGVISSGFSVADSDALDAAETELERSGISVHRGSAAEARSRRVREFIGFDDPFGNRVELVNQQETVARPVAFSRAAGITEFGHLCLDAPDVHEAYRFWSTRFNARVSDWLGDAACLMRIDPVHHKLAVFRGDEALELGLGGVQRVGFRHGEARGDDSGGPLDQGQAVVPVIRAQVGDAHLVRRDQLKADDAGGEPGRGVEVGHAGPDVGDVRERDHARCPSCIRRRQAPGRCRSASHAPGRRRRPGRHSWARSPT